MNRYLKVIGILAALVFLAVFGFSRVKDLRGGESTESAVTAKNSSAHVAEAVLREESKKYFNPTYKFSFEYHGVLTAQTFKEAEGETIVFRDQNPKSDSEKLGFQIFVSPFEGEALTVEKILEHLPALKIEQPLTVIINPEALDYTEALIFWSEDLAIGRTREVWFAHGGYLYEITARRELDQWLAKIMSSWRFANTEPSPSLSPPGGPPNP